MFSSDTQQQNDSAGSTHHPSILIVGGGPAGLALAAHLLSEGWSCRVLERRTRESLLADTNSFYDMASSGIQALLRIADGAAAQAVFKEAVAYDKVAVYMDRKPRPTCHMEWKSRSLGMPMFNITRAALLKALCEAVEELDPKCIQFETSARLVDYKQGVVEVVKGPNGSSTKLEADLVVAADGVHSRLRKHIFGDTGLRSDGIVACYAVLPPLTQEELETFPKPPGLTGDAYGILGMASDFVQYAVVNRVATIWYANFSLDKPYIGVPPTPDDGWLGEARKYCKSGGIPAMEALIDRTQQDQIQVTMCCDRSPLESYHRGRVVLVGDAAHPFTPFAGLGSSQAMVDAFCLGEALLRCNDTQEAVQTYESQRLEAANALMDASRELCSTSWSARLSFKFLEIMFAIGKIFSKTEAVADLMNMDGTSMVNDFIPFKSEKDKAAYEARYEEAKSSLEAQITSSC